MLKISPIECRVLGVLVEKSLTVQSQYPLTLNSVTIGCNQKNNRLPVVNYAEDEVIDALDSLRAKGFVREVMLSSSRVPKFRHVAREILDIQTRELVVLVELLLRGPATLGEIRGRASRMHPLDSLDDVKDALNILMTKIPDEPLVKRIDAAPGTKADRYVQLLCPNLHPITTAVTSASAHTLTTSSASVVAGKQFANEDITELQQRVDKLETQVDVLQEALRKIAASLGEPDPML